MVLNEQHVRACEGMQALLHMRMKPRCSTDPPTHQHKSRWNSCSQPL